MDTVRQTIERRQTHALDQDNNDQQVIHQYRLGCLYAEAGMATDDDSETKYFFDLAADTLRESSLLPTRLKHTSLLARMMLEQLPILEARSNGEELAAIALESLESAQSNLWMQSITSVDTLGKHSKNDSSALGTYLLGAREGIHLYTSSYREATIPCKAKAHPYADNTHHLYAADEGFKVPIRLMSHRTEPLPNLNTVVVVFPQLAMKFGHYLAASRRSVVRKVVSLLKAEIDGEKPNRKEESALDAMSKELVERIDWFSKRQLQKQES